MGRRAVLVPLRSAGDVSLLPDRVAKFDPLRLSFGTVGSDRFAQYLSWGVPVSGFSVRSRAASILVTLAVALGAQAMSSSQLAHAVPSADGARVAFALTTGGFSQIYTMNPDGSDVQAVPGQPAGVNNTDPATSPDGTKIAFTSNQSGNLDVWVIDLAGTNLTQLTTDAGADSAPAWSPDGNTIAFQSNRSTNMDIWLMNPDGSSETRLTSNPAADGQPAWFPTGRKIAFQSGRTGGTDIYTVNANGTGIKRVTTSIAPDTQPSVGPGGGTIAFTSKRGGNSDIYTVPVAGGTNVRVTTNPAIENQPAFSTDGRRLAFTSNRTGITQIFAVPRPTGAAVQITNGTDPAAAADYMPYTYPTTAWANRVTSAQTGGQNNYPYAIAASPDGTKVFSAGGVYTNGRDVDGYITAYTSTGTYLWTHTFNALGFNGLFYGGAYALAVSPDSATVYVGGYAGNNFWVSAYNTTTGVLQNSWKVNAGGGFCTVWTMSVSSDGSSLYVAGTQYSPSTGFPVGSDTMSISTSTFTTNWSKFNTKTDPVVGSMRLSPSGDAVYWTGEKYGTNVNNPAQNNYATLAYQTSDGSKNWGVTYNPPANGEDDAEALAVSPDGTRVYVSGWSWSGTSSKADQATVSYAASDGSLQWATRYNSPSHGFDWGNSIGVSPDGLTVYVGGGRTRSVGGKLTNDYETTALNSGSGVVNWARFYNGPGDYTKNDVGDTIFGLNVSSDGSRIFVTGHSYRTGTSFDIASVAYDASGNQLWIARYNGPNNGPEYLPSSTLSSDGQTLYVTGQSKGATYFAGATAAWDVGGVFAGPAARSFQRVADSSATTGLDLARRGPRGDGVPAGMRIKQRMEALIRSH